MIILFNLDYDKVGIHVVLLICIQSFLHYCVFCIIIYMYLYLFVESLFGLYITRLNFIWGVIYQTAGYHYPFVRTFTTNVINILPATTSLFDRSPGIVLCIVLIYKYFYIHIRPRLTYTGVPVAASTLAY